jgi:hypothetical protein
VLAQSQMTERDRILKGGYLNQHCITKEGRTVVRRQDHPWPYAVSEALEILRQRGFNRCPIELSRLDPSSVVLTYMPGRALPDLAPPWAASPLTLVRVTRLISSFSAAAEGMRGELTHSDWLIPEMSEGTVLVHGDPHPTNIVFNIRRKPCAIIDFELATLGTHEWNLVSLIFSWAPLEPVHHTCWRLIPFLPVSDRIKIILDNWPIPTTKERLVETAKTFVEWRCTWISELARLGNAGAVAFMGDRNLEDRYGHALGLIESHADLAYSRPKSDRSFH